MSGQMPRILIAATASGAGKTTLTCGLLQALKNRGLKVAACKCGPDFIDPMFHREVIGAPSRNLDLFLADGQTVRVLLGEVALAADITVIEGAMGYYDGIAQTDAASAYDVARVTKTPVVLVVDGRGRALSVCAEIRGFLGFRSPSQVVGVILNRVSATYAPTMSAMIERECGVAVLGYVPTLDEATLESRHLGLVSAPELADLQQRLDVVARALAQTVDLDRLMQMAHAAPVLDGVPVAMPRGAKAREVWAGAARARVSGAGEAYEDAVPAGTADDASVRARHDAAAPAIAVAQDEAFSFYYPETLALFERLGARLVPFSPLADEQLPPGTCGLYLGGGYPELHARRLSCNARLRAQIAELVAAGLPTIAECGGFLYLHQSMVDAKGDSYPMVGVVPGRCFRASGLRRFGYVTLTALHDGLLACTGESLPAHEFHYWESTNAGASFHARKPQSTRAWDCVVATRTLFAGFPHLYLAAQPQVALRFVRACVAYGSVGGAC